MKKAISLILLLLVSVIFVSCDMKNTKDEKTIAKKETIKEKVKKVKSVNEFIKLLNGTTWHYTESLSNSEIGCWLKLEFSGDEYTLYHALPGDGKWTLNNKGKLYDCGESRYSNTGKKYFYVTCRGEILNSTKYRFKIPAEIAITNNHQLLVFSEEIDALIGNGRETTLRGIIDYGDYSWD